jgi:phospholipid-translocating ATPase
VGIEYKGDEIIQNTTNSTLVRKITYNNKYEKKDKTYDVLHTLEFDSDRKRMSVIVRDHQRNEYVLFCKGADSSMIKRCSGGDERIYETPMRKFAENGWRVIVIAYRVLNESEYRQFDAMLAQNHTDSALFDKIESGLHIVGVTAVEDKLQEDVEITLSELRQAGIKIWVLTGDKLETSVNISDSCRHFSPDMIRFIVKDMKEVSEIEKHFSDIKERYLTFLNLTKYITENGFEFLDQY